MNINHESALPVVWKSNRLSWRDKRQVLQGMWNLALWATPENDREEEEQKQATDDLNLLVLIAIEHQQTDRALAA